ncbi:MAG: DedA family protein [Cyanobacteria bacterium REEB65]|nr:DedA family protein [Cyanobacteria bacterium REEB65]
MFSHLVASLAAWATGLLATFGYGGVVLSMAIQSACVPIPSEVIMPAAGVLVAKGTFNFHLAAAAGAVGNLLGSWVAYWVGMAGGRPFLARYGRYCFVSERDLDQSERFFARFGDAAVFLGRVLPVVRSFISLPAGIAKMGFWRFTIYSLVGSWIWSYALLWAGLKLGQNLTVLHSLMHRFDLAMGLLLFAGAGWYVWKHLPRPGRAPAAL